VVAFGSFPFAMFVSTFAVDSIRYFQHNRSNEYLPWPFKGVGAVETPREDREKALIAAAVVSVAIAAIDFTIVQVKRNREKARVEQQNNGGGVRIIRNPIIEDELAEENLETGGDSGGESP
jgi:hypothetical protein